MTVPGLFAVLGGVILVGFLANLLFRLTRIPTVLVLIGIGVLLGPVTGWIRGDTLLAIAPYFGAVALVIILFEGGLELEIGHVIRHAPRTAVFATLVFGLSLAAVTAVAYAAFGLPLRQALMLGAILGATSPAICMPVVSGLSVRSDVKTVIKLESAIGEVLLIVSVVLLIQSYDSGGASAAGWVWGFVRSFLVALIVSSVAGVFWSRLVGWMGREPLSYMLTLGTVCLLYFVVEELGGSPAIAVLLFGMMLANMQDLAGRFGPRVRDLFGIDVRQEQFVLGQFMVNITAELSFLVRTFFFVYLGLLLDLSALSWSYGLWIAATFGLLLVSRRAGVALFRSGGVPFTAAEWQAIMALQPRGLATAVVAFMPMHAGIAGTDGFPMYAFLVIVLSNLYMTGGILFAERRLAAAPPRAAAEALVPAPAAPAFGMDAVPGAPQPAAPRRAPLFSPARDFEDEPAPATLTDWMARFFGLRLADREVEYAEMIRASYFSEPLFWVQAALGASICALGLILDQVAIVVGGALILPLARPVIATGLALASGDVYLLVKLAGKLLVFSLLVIGLSAVYIDLMPFAFATGEILARTKPTIVDFVVALFGGMSGAALISLRRKTFYYLPGAVIAITLLPALCVIGFGLGHEAGSALLRGAALQFSANLFAAVLGAGTVLVAVGIPRAAEAAAVRQWKEEALGSPLAQAVFGRLRVQHLIGRTGSIRARVIVVGLFLLVLITPLQQALNHLTLEFRTRQAIARAQAAFTVPNRSAVVSSGFTIGEAVVDVRIQVATNALFGHDDLARFEQRVSDQTGLRTRLDLVQTVADVGSAGTIRRLLEDRRSPTPERAATVSDELADASRLVSRLLDDLPLPPGLRILAVRGSLAGLPGPALAVVYLSEQELGADAQSMLTRLLAAGAGLPDGGVAVRWVPARWPVRFTRSGGIMDGDEGVLRDVVTILGEYPALTAQVLLPAGLAGRALEAARQSLRTGAGPGARISIDERETSEGLVGLIRLSDGTSP